MIGVGLGVSLLGIINRRPLIITGYTDMTHLNQYSGIDQGWPRCRTGDNTSTLPRPRQRRRCATLERSEALGARQAR